MEIINAINPAKLAPLPFAYLPSLSANQLSSLVMTNPSTEATTDTTKMYRNIFSLFIVKYLAIYAKIFEFSMVYRKSDLEGKFHQTK